MMGHNNGKLTNTTVTLRLTEKEERLIGELRKIMWGRFTVVVKQGKPVRIEHIRESIILT